MKYVRIIAKQTNRNNLINIRDPPDIFLKIKCLFLCSNLTERRNLNHGFVKYILFSTFTQYH